MLYLQNIYTNISLHVVCCHGDTDKTDEHVIFQGFQWFNAVFRVLN